MNLKRLTEIYGNKANGQVSVRELITEASKWADWFLKHSDPVVIYETELKQSAEYAGANSHLINAYRKRAADMAYTRREIRRWITEFFNLKEDVEAKK
jgi:hypothetical protein